MCFENYKALLKKTQRNWDSHTSLVRKKNGAASVETSLVVFQKVTHRITTDSAISLLAIHPKELKAETQTGTYILVPMFIAVLFTVAKRYKQPKCTSIENT